MHHLSNITLYASFFVSLYFEVFLLIHFLEKRSITKSEETRTLKTFPSITIIVPVYNEEHSVTKTIFSLLKLEYPKDRLKIILVNDGSTDSTARVIERFRKNKRITLLEKENGGKYTALNAGLARTTTELVGCLDADSFVPPDTLKKILPYFENDKIMAVTPAIKIHEPDSFIRHVQSNEYNLGIFMKKCFSQLEAITVTPGPFSIFRKEVFTNLGTFKEAYNTEDLEIALRMQKNFYRIANAHTAVVYTVGPSSLRKLYRQRVRWIQGFLANSLEYRTFFFNRKYGHLGLFTFPIAFVSIGLFLLSVSMTLWNIGLAINKKMLEIQSVGWQWHMPEMRFDWFFFNTDSSFFLSALLFAGSILLIVYGSIISEKKPHISIHTFFFPIVYGFLSIFLLVKGVYITALSRQSPWR